MSLSIARERVGMVGVNGSGKTTLARVLAGEVRAQCGSVRREGRIGYLPQRIEDSLGERTVAEVFGRAASEGLESAEAAALARLGVGWVHPLTPMSQLSGGERMRVALAALVAREPEVLVLDEPTNNLDIEARRALYALVGSWRGGMLVISHDRQLLGLVDAIVELTRGGIKRYGGNYALYEEQKRLEEAAAEHAVDQAAKELRRAERDSRTALDRQGRREARGKAASERRGVPKIVLGMMRGTVERSGAKLRAVHGSRVEAAAEGLAGVKSRVERQRKLDFGLGDADVPEGKMVVAVEGLWFSHDAGTGSDGAGELFSGLDLRIVGPRRVAVVGANGSGKSTLLRLISGELTAQRGSVRIGVERWALLDQHAAVLEAGSSVLENFVRLNTGAGESEARTALARFVFRGGAAERRVGELSGGERLRAALACVLGGSRPASLVMLDEPGNHLDLESLGELEGALRGFGGALLVVSHDESFLRAVGVEEEVRLGKGMGAAEVKR